MKHKVIYIITAVTVGFLFNKLNMPAGWLLGSLITGIIFGVFIKKISFEQNSFKIALAFVGANISLLLNWSTLKTVYHLILPLFITIIITITAGFLFGVLLFKKTKKIDKITAFFCCIPGGASEIIGISGEYGADDRLVAAFHTVRITFFTISIPLIVTFMQPTTDKPVIEQIDTSIDVWTIIFFVIVIITTLLLDRLFKIPGGTLIFSIFIGFLITEFSFGIDQVPGFLAGMGQALIGAFVGIRFDKEVLSRLLKVGPITIMIIMLFFILTLCTAFIFKLLTGIPYATSLISTVPAGAAEMSVTAVALEVNPTVVASLHIIRVISLFLSLPFLLKIFMYLNKDYKKENIK